MQIPDENTPIVSAPRSTLDVSRCDAPEAGELRAFARALIELALQLNDDTEEGSEWTP
jgi:hypothetical protein